jgi:pyruvate dehydrogenase E1 component alpha subunit
MAQVLPAERDLRRVIGDGESVPDGEVEGLTDHDLVELYRGLVLLRTYDERSVVYHSQGRIGTYAIYWNHEAMQAGSVYALEDDDWIFPSYRESAIGLLRGLPVSTVLSWWRGHPAGWWNPADYNVASICVPIGTHVPHAAGLAWGKRLRGGNACAIAYFGDGATSEGAFHEGANFAAVMRAPLVLFCNNNGWAISTPVEAQTRAETLADKAVGYGMPAARVDGLDILAVYEEKKRECVGRYEGYLRRAGILTDEMAESIRAEAEQAMRDGIAAAEAEAPADPGLLFEHALVDPPASFETDLAELRRVLGG